MSRRPRLDGEGAVHHVMNRGVNHQPIFFGDEDRIEFGARLAEIHDRFGVETLAYALMTNHYHLLLRTPAAALSQAMHHLGLVYAKRTNARIGRDGTLFRGRFHSIRVTTDAYLTHATRYIHRNPLDLPGVARLADYRWASYRTYTGARRPAPFMNTSLVLSLFGGDRLALERFTLGANSSLRGAVTVDDVAQLVQLEIGVRGLQTSEDDEGLPTSFPRAAMLLVSDEVADARLGEAIVDAIGFPTPAAARRAQLRARQRATDPVLRGIVDEVLAVVAASRDAA